LKPSEKKQENRMKKKLTFFAAGMASSSITAQNTEYKERNTYIHRASKSIRMSQNLEIKMSFFLIVITIIIIGCKVSEC
jgi:hypothetical protein